MPALPGLAKPRPWWEWIVFGLGVVGGIGGLKAIWDWTIVPFLQRPKLSGTLEKLVLRARGVTEFPENTTTDWDTAFDAEIRMCVSAYNKRQQQTSLKKWVLRVRAQGKQWQELVPIPNRDLETRRGRNFDSAAFMPEAIKFEWRSPTRGWLYFRYANISRRTLSSAKYKLVVVDIDDRRHRLFAGVLPAAPGKPPNGVLSVLTDADI